MPTDPIDPPHAPADRSSSEIDLSIDGTYDLSVLQKVARRSALLADVARLLLRGTDARDLTDAVVVKVMSLLSFERGCVATASSDGHFYDMRCIVDVRDDAEPTDELDVPIDRGIAGRVIRTRRNTYLPAIDQPDTELGVVDEALEGGRLQSVLGIPLMSGDRVFGALLLGAERPTAFSRSDVKVARQVGDMLALAWERHRQSRRLESMVERLQRTNLELDTFIYSASHDLRAPLLSIAGLTDLARLAVATGQGDELSEYLDRIHHNVQRLDGVVIDILQLNRARRMAQEPEAVHLHELIGGVIEMLAAMDDASDVKLNVRCAVSQPIHLEKRRLRQVLNNLVANGIRYRNRRRKDPIVEVLADIEGADLVIRVIDNGIGIPAGDEERIFNMFYRASNQGHGSGLGLYLVKEHASAMGATVTAKSTAEGTIFEVRKPLEQ